MENSSYFKDLCSYIIDDDLKKVEDFLKSNPEFLKKYNSDDSPVIVALQQKRFGIYYLLLSYGFSLRLPNDFEKMIEDFSRTEQWLLRDIHWKYAKAASPECISFLSSRSKLSHATSEDERSKFNKALLKAYEELYSIEDVKPILEVIAHAENFEVHFDPKRRSIIFINPATSKSTLGIVYHNRGDTFIGAKGLTENDDKRLEATGVLAHELTHYGLNLTYDNKCKPYCKNDVEKSKRLDDILNNIDEIRLAEIKNEEIIDSVFKYYEKDLHHAEIIVRPPQLLVYYRIKHEELKQCRDAYLKLFEFYSEVLTEIRQELPLMVARKLLNEKCEVLSKLKRSVYKLHTETSLNKTAETVQSKLIKSNCPELTINTIYHETMYDFQHGITSIFIKLEHVNNNDLFKLMKKTYQLIAKPKFIIDCDGYETSNIIKTVKKLANNNFKERLIFIVHDSFNENDFPMKVDAIEIKHQWKDLTDDCKEEVLIQAVTFQGKEIPLVEIAGSKNFQSIPRKMLTKIRIASEIFPVKFKFYIERKFIPENSSNTGFATNDLQIEYNSQDLLRVTENCKTIFIEGNAKYGKSMEMKTLAKMLKENYPEKWICFIDLKSLEKFDKPIGHSIKDILEFVCKEDLSHNEFSMEIFMHLFDSGQVIFLLDEIDEVFTVQTTFITNFVLKLREQSINQIWIAVRPPVSKELTPTMQARVFKLKPFLTNDLPEIYSYFLQNAKDDKKTKDDIDTFLKSLEMFDFIHPGIFEIIMDFLKSNSSSDLKRGNVNLDFLELKGGAKKIVGFWGSWSPYNVENPFFCSDIDPQLFTHLVYTYIGITETFDIDFKDHYQMIEKFIVLKIQNKNLKLIASVGGCNENTTNLLSHIAAEADLRETFATNAVNFLKECGLDGLDINWNNPTKDDRDNFVLLLKALRQAFNVPKYILTVTVNPTKTKGDVCYNAHAISKTVDFVYLLAFDLHLLWEKKTAANAPLYAGSVDHAELSVDACVRYWCSKVNNSEKLVLGVGTYGQLYQLTDPNCHGIGASISADFYQKLSYQEILDNCWETNWSAGQNDPYAFCGDKWVTYENEESIEKKAKYAKFKNLGGILIYSIEFDSFKGENGQERFPLVKAARRVLCE